MCAHPRTAGQNHMAPDASVAAATLAKQSSTPRLVVQVLGELNTYIEIQRHIRPEAVQRIAGLRAVATHRASGLIANIKLIQSGKEDVHLRIRRDPRVSPLSTTISSSLLSGLQVGARNRWLPFPEWMDRRYGTQSPPEDFQSNEYIYHTLHHTATSHIDQRRRTDFDFWRKTQDIKVALELFHRGPFWYCTYTLPGQRPKTVLVRRVPSRSPRTELEIGGPGGWQRFATWINQSLESLTPAELTMDDWWKTNGTAFRFMDLPAELRENVHGQITGASIWPRMDSWNIYINTDMRVFKRSQASQSIVLPGVSKTIQAELKQYTWAGAMLKSFQDPYDFFPLALYLRFSFGPNAIRRISLNFSNDQLFKFLGIRSRPLTGFGSTELVFEGISRLKELDTLHHLHFKFETSPPYWQDSTLLLNDPWHDFRFGSQKLTKDVSCQKTFVDWFLTLAFDGLRHIPILTYSGHIKNSTRQKWDKIFHDERHGKVHDFSLEIEGIQSTPLQNLPPICVCEKACDFWNIHGPHLEGEAPAYQPSSTKYWVGFGFHEYDPETDDRFDCDG